MDVLIQQMILDDQIQPRAQIDSATVSEYAEDMKAGAKFPPVVVFRDGARLWLADGFHRIYAAKVAKLEWFPAEVKEGTRDDAILYSVGANAQHGKRRTNEDKRRAVMALLRNPEWERWSDSEIARRCAVDHKTVGSLRESLGNFPGDNATVKYSDRWGHEREMNTTSIGKREEPVTDLDQPKPPALAPEPSQPTPRALVDVFSQPAAPRSKSQFNLTNDNIKWAKWTWNPVTGCLHGCPYCYAREIANRFTGHFDPAFHPERMDAPQNTNPLVGQPGGSNVFVCSMADLFGDWVPQEWIDQVLDAVRKAPQWTFLFLSKNPERMATIDWPDNAWVGTTVDRQERVLRASAAFRQVRAVVRFVSCEPILEPLDFHDMRMFDWLIVGAQSAANGQSAFQPEWSWVMHLIDTATMYGLPIYWKDNLDKPQQYPKG